VAGTQRRERVAEAIGQVIAEEIRCLKDPRIGLCSVVRAEVTPDLRRARVHVSLLAEGRERARAMRALKGATGHLRARLGAKLPLRFTPELELLPDDAIAETLRLSGLAAALAQDAGGDDAERGSPGPV
jgi:ribosome-binding factor A